MSDLLNDLVTMTALGLWVRIVAPASWRYFTTGRLAP